MIPETKRPKALQEDNANLRVAEQMLDAASFTSLLSC